LVVPRTLWLQSDRQPLPLPRQRRMRAPDGCPHGVAAGRSARHRVGAKCAQRTPCGCPLGRRHPVCPATPLQTQAHAWRRNVVASNGARQFGCARLARGYVYSGTSRAGVAARRCPFLLALGSNPSLRFPAHTSRELSRLHLHLPFAFASCPCPRRIAKLAKTPARRTGQGRCRAWRLAMPTIAPLL